MKKKKLLALFGAALLVFGTVCGCGNAAGSAPKIESGQEESADKEEAAKEEADDTGAPQEDSDGAARKGQSFAQAHDAFKTTLVREENDDYEIPAPPEGLFDLVSYPSKVGDLAAYVSSDPQDGQKHPMIIWVVGGWGNGIDDFPWCYPEWDNDQTGSAFWQNGILTMYPSFRGG